MKTLLEGSRGRGQLELTLHEGLAILRQASSIPLLDDLVPGHELEFEKIVAPNCRQEEMLLRRKYRRPNCRPEGKALNPHMFCILNEPEFQPQTSAGTIARAMGVVFGSGGVPSHAEERSFDREKLATALKAMYEQTVEMYKTDRRDELKRGILERISSCTRAVEAYDSWNLSLDEEIGSFNSVLKKLSDTPASGSDDMQELDKKILERLQDASSNLQVQSLAERVNTGRVPRVLKNQVLVLKNIPGFEGIWSTTPKHSGAASEIVFDIKAAQFKVPFDSEERSYEAQSACVIKTLQLDTFSQRRGGCETVSVKYPRFEISMQFRGNWMPGLQPRQMVRSISYAMDRKATLREVVEKESKPWLLQFGREKGSLASRNATGQDSAQPLVTLRLSDFTDDLQASGVLPDDRYLGCGEGLGEPDAPIKMYRFMLISLSRHTGGRDRRCPEKPYNFSAIYDMCRYCEPQVT